jgi:DNA mismatch repair protein MutH
MQSFVNSPPQSEQELWHRATSLANKTLGALANEYHLVMPQHFRREKGFIGQLLERVLGASAGSLSKPDFVNLGIELKTIPLNLKGSPKESTYISIVPLMSKKLITWRESEIYHKLRHVLWIPYFFDNNQSPHEWQISAPVLWSPNEEEETILKEDWQELMSLVQLGQLDKINARLGQYLQIRPKAMHASIRTRGIGDDGKPVNTPPLGFYLRTAFTKTILQR